MTNVLVVGSSNTDMTIRVAHIPGPGETVLGGSFSMALGGKGANQAVAAARAGGRVTFVARVGADVFGAQALRGFAADGIDTRFVIKDARAPSGVALINVDANGENCISVASGANALLSPEDIRKADAAFEGADIVLLQLETPDETVREAAAAARARGIPVILNPAPARVLDGRLLEAVAVLTPNEFEAGLLAGPAWWSLRWENGAFTPRAEDSKGRCPPSRFARSTRRRPGTSSAGRSPWGSPKGGPSPPLSVSPWPPRPFR
jgi:ribokinase